MSKHFFLVAGEASGDILGARLISALKLIYPKARFSGIGGPLMSAEGFDSLFPMERLSVMGVVPILKRLPELLKMRSKLANLIINSQPDCFIGIDAPEFNTGLEYKLRQHEIKTVHYVSPSVWAWREKRIFKIKKSVSLMLCLFPFELLIYQHHKIPAVCVGHPLANEIDIEPNTSSARNKLKISADELVVALLPGSRGSEVKYLIEPFLKTAILLKQKYPEIQFILPCANEKRRTQVEQYILQENISLPISLVDGESRLVMQAADVVLLASGTATLEALLLKKPMLVAYKMSRLSFWIFKKRLKIKQYSLPNLLAGQAIVKEMIQEDCEPELLFEQLVMLIESREDSPQIESFKVIHQSLMLGGSEKAANAIKEMLET